MPLAVLWPFDSSQSLRLPHLLFVCLFSILAYTQSNIILLISFFYRSQKWCRLYYFWFCLSLLTCNFSFLSDCLFVVIQSFVPAQWDDRLLLPFHCDLQERHMREWCCWCFCCLSFSLCSLGDHCWLDGSPNQLTQSLEVNKEEICSVAVFKVNGSNTLFSRSWLFCVTSLSLSLFLHLNLDGHWQCRLALGTTVSAAAIVH